MKWPADGAARTKLEIKFSSVLVHPIQQSVALAEWQQIAAYV